MNFIIQKLKNKHIFLKKLSNWAKLNSLILREREETITKYFAPRAIEGYFFYENLRLNQQLDVIEYGGVLQNLLKTFIFRGFFLSFAKLDEEFYSF